MEIAVDATELKLNFKLRNVVSEWDCLMFMTKSFSELLRTIEESFFDNTELEDTDVP